VAEALLMRENGAGLNANDWLDLVAVGTVADIVPLVGENRALVKAGLERLRAGRRQGLFSLGRVAEINYARLTARDIGFVLGPRLNAAGRLESALASLQLLIAQDLQEIGRLAQDLDNWNRQRQEKTRSMQETAEMLTTGLGSADLIFATHPEFNMGVVGLVASRLTETYYRPSVVGAIDKDGFTRASCRSIPEFHITHALDECGPMLERYGGHAMAAGFTVRTEKLPLLMEQLKQIAARELGGRELRPVLKAEMLLPLRDLRPAVLQDIDLLEPTGLANPPVLFQSCGVKVDLKRVKAVGADKRHLRMFVGDGNITYPAIAFQQGHWAEHMPDMIDVVYSYEVNEFNGNTSIQLNIKDLRPSGEQV